ncbi:hypothetical protein [Burkholderia metallica]|uniref:hypothetical protein n=1 Tax=Burkholderia metallica TaxID=488729 RepID=UPI00131D5559|nr:hypothetical protein [Burkholderia metallica]
MKQQMGLLLQLSECRRGDDVRADAAAHYWSMYSGFSSDPRARIAMPPGRKAGRALRRTRRKPRVVPFRRFSVRRDFQVAIAVGAFYSFRFIE